MEPPKSSISCRLGFSIKNHPAMGYPHLIGNLVIQSSIALPNGEDKPRVLAQDMKNNSRLEPVDVLFPGEDGHDGTSEFWDSFGVVIWVWINTYKNTIFRGMNIHKSQLF
jgi:hypothetical protein